MRPHVIRQGESLSTLARDLQFEADAVWAHKRNGPLRTCREDREILHPGDILYVPEDNPEEDRKRFALKSGTTTKFVASVEPLVMHIRCVDDASKPLAGESFVIEGTDPPVEGTTDGDGVAKVEVLHKASRVRLFFSNLGVEIVGRVAHLDPVTERSGQRQRLEALGLLGRMPPLLDPDEAAEMEALILKMGFVEFQRQNGLPKTGIPDDATCKALVDAHGA